MMAVDEENEVDCKEAKSDSLHGGQRASQRRNMNSAMFSEKLGYQ